MRRLVKRVGIICVSLVMMAGAGFDSYAIAGPVLIRTGLLLAHPFRRGEGVCREITGYASC